MNNKDYIAENVEKELLEDIDFSILNYKKESTRFLIHLYTKLLFRFIKYYGPEYKIKGFILLKEEFEEVKKNLSKKENLEFEFYINYIQLMDDPLINEERYNLIYSNSLFVLELGAEGFNIKDYYEKIVKLEEEENNSKILNNF